MNALSLNLNFDTDFDCLNGDMKLGIDFPKFLCVGFGISLAGRIGVSSKSLV